MPNDKTVLTDAEIEAGRHQVFSTNNPFCPCDSKTFAKAARWAEAATIARQAAALAQPRVSDDQWKALDAACDVLESSQDLSDRVAARIAALAAKQPGPFCIHCGDLGDVHGLDGEWRGVCSCHAGKLLGARIAFSKQPAAPAAPGGEREALANELRAWVAFVCADYRETAVTMPERPMRQVMADAAAALAAPSAPAASGFCQVLPLQAQLAAVVTTTRPPVSISDMPELQRDLAAAYARGEVETMGAAPAAGADVAALVEGKTQARHAIELIADWYDHHDEGHRAAVARRSSDKALLDVIKSVLQDLANTEAAYMGEKGNNRQRDEIARLKGELKTAKSPQADIVAALNQKLIAANVEIDRLSKLAALAGNGAGRVGLTDAAWQKARHAVAETVEALRFETLDVLAVQKWRSAVYAIFETIHPCANRSAPEGDAAQKGGQQ